MQHVWLITIQQPSDRYGISGFFVGAWLRFNEICCLTVFVWSSAKFEVI